MTTTIEAIFDGSVLRPAQPLALEPNTRVRVTLETLSPASDSSGKSFFDVARQLNLQPSDWSVKLDTYLYTDPQDANG
jgi:hypothetical protein